MKTFIALYMGKPGDTSGPGDMKPEDIGRGMQAWGDWMARNADRVTVPGGPVGKTKRVGPDGISDVRNLVSGFTVLQAESQEEAAKLFEGHPHFSIFPGDSVEIMEVMPIPTGP